MLVLGTKVKGVYANGVLIVLADGKKWTIENENMTDAIQVFADTFEKYRYGLN